MEFECHNRQYACSKSTIVNSDAVCVVLKFGGWRSLRLSTKIFWQPKSMSSESKLSSSETSPAKEKVANEDSSKDDALFVGNADSSNDNARFLPCLMWGGCDAACLLHLPFGDRHFPTS